MPAMDQVLLLLGGNEGDPIRTFQRASRRLEVSVGKVLCQSRDHWTLPWGFQAEGLFLNRALLLESHLSPDAIMEQCLGTERALGRIRTGGPGYASRSIDIDILMIGDRVVTSPTLEIPHPRMQQRAFALAPAADIVPAWVHPLLGRSTLQLLNDLLRPAYSA